MESNDVKAIESLMRLFARALDNLYNRECDIVRNDVNERCMAAHVFSYMKNKWNQFKRLRSYQLDYEYNREGESVLPKKLYCKYVKDKKAQWHLIIPDMIVRSGTSLGFMLFSACRWTRQNLKCLSMVKVIRSRRWVLGWMNLLVWWLDA